MTETKIIIGSYIRRAIRIREFISNELPDEYKETIKGLMGPYEHCYILDSLETLIDDMRQDYEAYFDN